MANDKIEVIVAKQAYEQVAKLDTDLQGLYKTFLQLYDVSKKAGGNPFNLPTKGGTSQAKKGLTELEKVMKNNAVLQERINIAQNESVKTQSRLREELRVTNLKTKQVQQENSKLVGAYGNLTAKLARLRREYKDVAVAEGEMSKSAIRLRKEVIELDSKVKKVDASVGQFQRNVGNYPTTFKGAIKSVGNFARSMFGAFGAIEGARLAMDFAKESLEVAKQAKGVEFAFNRLGDRGIKAFEDIKKATRGTLSDLQIKKSINEFDNLGISLEQSGVAFEFLSVRAAQTGKTVESMKEDLVTGLGRGSVRILDNLGLSMSELNKLTKEQGLSIQEAFGVIAQREIEKAGDILDSAVSDTEKWAAALENVQVKFGKFLNTGNIGLIGYLAQQLNKVADSFDVIDEGITTAETALNQFLKPFRELGDRIPFLNKSFSSTNGIFSKFIGFLTTPGLEVFGNFLKDVSFRLAGVGGVINEVINRFKNFKTELLDFASLDFSSPIALFNSLQKKFNNIVNESTDFTIAYQKAQVDLALALLETKKEEENLNEINLKGNNTLKENTKLLKEKKKIIEDTMTLEDYIANKNQIVGVNDVDNEFGVTDDIQDISLEDSLNAFARVFGFNPEEMKDLWYDFTQDMNQIGKEATLNDFFDGLNKSAELSEELLKDLSDRSKELGNQIADTLIQSTNQIFDNRLERYDEDIDRNNEYYANLLDNEQLSEEQRSQIEAERDVKNAEIEKKKRKTEREAFLFKQAAAAGEVLIETFKAVAAIKAQAAILAANPLTAPLAATALAQIPFAIASGAIGGAAILGTTIQAFKHGKKASDNYEGIALLNDGGRDEVMVSPDGTIQRITGRNVLGYVGKDDVIYPSEQAFMNDLNNASVMASITNNGRSLSGSSDRNNFDRALIGIRAEVKEGIKQGFKGVKMNVNNTVNTSSREAYIRSKMN